MKKIFTLLVSITIFSCSGEINKSKISSNSSTSLEETKYVFQATYSQDFSMGDQTLVVIFQSLLKNLQEGKLDNISNYFTEDVVWSLPDGGRLEGRENVIKFLIDFWSSSIVENYNSAVHFAVKSNQGDQWVLVWDSQSVNGELVSYQEAVQFEGDKIVFLNTFIK